MSPKNINERIALLNIIDSYGPNGATLPEIQKEWANLFNGKSLDQKQFIRCRKDIKELCGVEIKCRKSKYNSKYYVSQGGAKSFLTMSALNTYLLQNIIGEPTFLKDRVFIDESYNNDAIRKVSRAISLRRNIKIRQKKIIQEFATSDGITYPVSVKTTYLEFEFTPYAIVYSTKWFMIGKKPGEEELLVFSLNNSESIDLGFDMGDSPNEFNLEAVLANYQTVFPISAGTSFPDDRLDFHCSMRTSSFKLF